MSGAILSSLTVLFWGGKAKVTILFDIPSATYLSLPKVPRALKQANEQVYSELNKKPEQYFSGANNIGTNQGVKRANSQNRVKKKSNQKIILNRFMQPSHDRM